VGVFSEGSAPKTENVFGIPRTTSKLVYKVESTTGHSVNCACISLWPHAGKFLLELPI
jgi:hypothetical protein